MSFAQPWEIKDRITTSGVSVYTPPAAADSPYYFTADEMEAVLRDYLIGNSDLADLPLRTRSKVAKGIVCNALGYDIPKTFRRASPRLPHPNIDVYAQQTNNLQIWNDEIDGSRRYVILVLREGIISEVFVIPGSELAAFDQTGTLTSKYQASLNDKTAGSFLGSTSDTEALIKRFGVCDEIPPRFSRIRFPQPGAMLSVQAIFDKLSHLIGETYSDPGITKERTRGEVVHRYVCQALGLQDFSDTGAFPDIMSQLVEVKLQLGPTVDLGLELPNSDDPLASVDGLVAARDIRYAVFYGTRVAEGFRIDKLILVTGADFFNIFHQFGGKVRNSKLQLRLPQSWFE